MHRTACGAAKTIFFPESRHAALRPAPRRKYFSLSSPETSLTMQFPQATKNLSTMLRQKAWHSCSMQMHAGGLWQHKDGACAAAGKRRRYFRTDTRYVAARLQSFPLLIPLSAAQRAIQSNSHTAARSVKQTFRMQTMAAIHFVFAFENSDCP